MTLLYFVTPAWQRFELTAVCLDQRLDVIRQLAAHNIEARCVVVADDANLDLARERGFDTVEQANEPLGRKFNDGIEYAARQGADYIVPIGSDSWVTADYFLGLHHRFVRTSRLYAAVTGDRLAELSVKDGKGAGPYVFPRWLLQPSGFRPAADERERHIDSSTVRGIVGSTGRRVPWTLSHDLGWWQYIGFRGTPTLTPYERLTDKWLVREHLDPWARLAAVYPPELVERARRALARSAGVEPAATGFGDQRDTEPRPRRKSTAVPA